MSYCVNCGAEHSDGSNFCPVCEIESANPLEKNIKKKEPDELLYPKTPLGKSEKPQSRYTLLLVVSIFLTVPVTITILSDVMLDGIWDWSAYVLASMLLFFVITVLPFFFKKNRPILFLCIDIVAVGIFLFAINQIGNWNWFFPFGFSLCLSLGLIVIMLASILRYMQISKTAKTSLIFVSIGLSSTCVELLIYWCFAGERLIGWSLYIIVSCIIFAIIAIIIDRSPVLKDEMRKRFFI